MKDNYYCQDCGEEPKTGRRNIVKYCDNHMKLMTVRIPKVVTYPIAAAEEDIKIGDAIEINPKTGAARRWRGQE